MWWWFLFAFCDFVLWFVVGLVVVGWVDDWCVYMTLYARYYCCWLVVGVVVLLVSFRLGVLLVGFCCCLG